MSYYETMQCMTLGGGYTNIFLLLSDQHIKYLGK